MLLDKRQIELAGVQLAVLASKNVAGAVSNRFQAIRNKKSLEEACNSYEEIINELIAERSQIIAIAQAHETELKRYTLGDEDIEYLQGTASAALDVVASFSPSTNLESFESLKSLISVDTLKAMRLLSSATNCPLSTISLDMRPAAGMWAFPYRTTCALGLLFFRRAASVVSIAHAYYWTHRTTMPTRMTAVPGYRASWLGDLARNR